MMTYNYDTGKITRDFVLKKVEHSCHADPEHTRLIGVMCRNCPHYLKEKTFYHSPKDEYILNTELIGTFVFCKYHKKDDEGTEEILHRMYDNLREEALTHYYD